MSMFCMGISGVVLLLAGCVSAQISHSKDWEIARPGRNKIIKCAVDPSMPLSSRALHLYMSKPGEAIRRIMHFGAGDKSAKNEDGIPQRFNGRISGQTVSLTISGIQPDDAATYYCAVWEGYNEKVFSSGTRLYVTSDDIKAPKVSVYPMSRPKDEKRVLLCQARGMFPDLVKFTWKYENGKNVELSGTDELLEQRDENPEVRVTSMLIIDQKRANSNSYACSVQHDSTNTNNDKSYIIKPSNPEEEKQPEVDPNSDPAPTCPSVQEQEHEEYDYSNNNDSTQIVRKLYLFSVTYMALLVKNVVYFCTVCFLLYKRRAENSQSVSNEPTRPGKVNKKTSL